MSLEKKVGVQSQTASTVKRESLDWSCGQQEPLTWVIDMTGAVLWGKVLLRLKGQETGGCETS